MTIFLGFVIFLAISTLVFSILAWRAPVGWEDREGFHYGEQYHAISDKSPANKKQ